MATVKEEIYDEQIFPLMAQVIEICKRHRIPMLFDVALGCESEDDDGQLKCTTVLLDDEYEPSPEMLQAYEHIRPKRATFAAFTITRTNQ